MRVDPKLLDALVVNAQNYRESVPVFRVVRRSVAELDEDAVILARRFSANFGWPDVRYSITRERQRSVVHLPENARVIVFHASGATLGVSGWAPFDRIIGVNYDDRESGRLIDQGEAAVRALQLDLSRDNEELRFERLWQIKASGATPSGERGPVYLLRAVAAFQRHLHGLPVVGRASVFVKLAGEGNVAAWGTEWRHVEAKPLDEARIIDPEAGARRVLAELQASLPGAVFTLDDFSVDALALAYFSLPRRRVQGVMQPVWIGKLQARDWMNRHQLVVVPAAAAPYEPISRPLAAPPLEARRPVDRVTRA